MQTLTSLVLMCKKSLVEIKVNAYLLLIISTTYGGLKRLKKYVTNWRNKKKKPQILKTVNNNKCVNSTINKKIRIVKYRSAIEYVHDVENVFIFLQKVNMDF